MLRVNLKNSLSMLGTNILGHDRDITNLHTHGLHVSPSGNSDNMMVMLMSGDTFTYEYDLSLQEPSSINFYHPHIHGSVAEQYWGGMAGTLDVSDEISTLSGFETHILFLKDISLSGSEPEPYTSMMYYMHGKEGSTVMVNGLVNPVLVIRPGQVQRWKIINQSGMDHPFHQHVNPCQVLSITGGDSGYASFYTTAPAWKDVVLIPKKGKSENPYARDGLRWDVHVPLPYR